MLCINLMTGASQIQVRVPPIFPLLFAREEYHLNIDSDLSIVSYLHLVALLQYVAMVVLAERSAVAFFYFVLVVTAPSLNKARAMDTSGSREDKHI